MNTKIKNIVVCVVMAVCIFGFAVLCLVLPKPEFLDSERREPAKFPELTVDSIMKDGAEYTDSFMKQFDDKYTPDNFPFRDLFKSLKAFVNVNVFGFRDKDGIYIENGYVAEMQEKIDENSIDHASTILNYIYNTYLKNKGITPYISIIPDKGYFLSEENGYPTMNYDEFIDKILAEVDFATYIKIKDSLSVEDYYKTDTHWRQEELVDIAKLLVDGMGGNHDSKYTVNELANPFKGVYFDRAPRPLKPETMYYLTNENMKNVKVYDHQNKKEISLYDMAKAEGKDPDDMFLGGELSAVTIENPDAKTDKELVIFRDSYGRSIIPLLVDDYAKITVIDIRYISSSMTLRYLVQFEDQDVLFLYSTLVLNASYEMKK